MADEEKKKRKRVVVEEVTENKEEVNSPEVASEVPTETVESAPGTTETTPKPEVPSETIKLPVTKEKREFNLFFFLLILFFAFLITVFIGGLYVYFNGTKDSDTNLPVSSASPSPTPVPDATPQPSANSSPTPQASNIKISVLNGSGKAGEAGKAKALLEKDSFNVDSTGNASVFTFTDTQIQVKSTVSSEIVAKIKDSLSESYSVIDGKALDSKSQFDVVITVGSKGAN